MQIYKTRFNPYGDYNDSSVINEQEVLQWMNKVIKEADKPQERISSIPGPHVIYEQDKIAYLDNRINKLIAVLKRRVDKDIDVS